MKIAVLVKLLMGFVILLALAACSHQPRPQLVVNASSTHLSDSKKDSSNFGVGLRVDNWEAGFFDNSRLYESRSYYLQKRVYQRGFLFSDVGAAYYDGGTDEHPYDENIVPILTLGAKWQSVEVGYALPDILFVRFPL